MTSMWLPAVLLAYLAVSVQGQFDTQCPVDAGIRMDKCLTVLESLSKMDYQSEICRTAAELRECSRRLVMACLNSGDPSILKVLGSRSSMAALYKAEPLSLCPPQPRYLLDTMALDMSSCC